MIRHLERRTVGTDLAPDRVKELSIDERQKWWCSVCDYTSGMSVGRAIAVNLLTADQARIMKAFRLKTMDIVNRNYDNGPFSWIIEILFFEEWNEYLGWNEFGAINENDGEYTQKVIAVREGKEKQDIFVVMEFVDDDKKEMKVQEWA